MKIFACERCGSNVAFADLRCAGCGAELAYVSGQRRIRVLHEETDAVHRIDGSDRAVWRCLNAAWGCNWTVDPGFGTPWCRSCSLTRGRPDVDRPDAVAAWIEAEAAKRWLVYQLDGLSLPVDRSAQGSGDGLVFDLVYIPGCGGVTGHLDGVVTLDLAEVDDQHRDELRRRFGEPFRTVIGHLRHESGHHYWRRLVGQSSDLREFRELFGDHSTDYVSAIEQFYTEAPQPDPERFVSPYAASHPLEDWAETFAHYLHIADATDTAVAHGLLDTGTFLDSENDIDELIGSWQPISQAVNAIAESLGVAAVYPFDLSENVITKIGFVHRQIAANAARDRFYTTLEPATPPVQITNS